MRIEREGTPVEKDPLRDGISTLVHGRPLPASPEERLLLERDARRRRLRTHWNGYISVIGGFSILNLLSALMTGDPTVWAVFPATVWGVLVAIHALGYRGWHSDHVAQIGQAESALGLIAPPDSLAALPLPNGVAESGAWSEIVNKSRATVERTKAALMALEHPAHDVESTHADLDEGQARIERLAEGAARIHRALAMIVPGGAEALDREIEEADARINQTEDDALRAARLENRTLLVARRAKLQSLVAEEERMLTNAQGFLIATENLHLDTARLGLGRPDSSDALTAPIQRLSEEVDVLRKVESELTLL